jgi:hypothetical protein
VACEHCNLQRYRKYNVVLLCDHALLIYLFQEFGMLYDSGQGGNHWSVACSRRSLSRDMEERTEIESIPVERHFVHKRPVNPLSQCDKDREKCFHAAQLSGGQYISTSRLQEQTISDITSGTTHLLENSSRE